MCIIGWGACRQRTILAESWDVEDDNMRTSNEVWAKSPWIEDALGQCQVLTKYMREPVYLTTATADY